MARLLVLLFLLLAAPDALAQAALSVRTAPTGADVFVDGERVGVAPLVVAVAPGARRVEARMGALAPAAMTVRVAAGDTAAVVLRFGGGTGRVRVEGLEAARSVETPGWALTDGQAALPEGTSTIRAVSADGAAVDAQFQVAPGALTTVTYVEDAFVPQRVVFGVALPGSVQLVRGRPLAGLAYAGALGAAVAVGLGARSAAADAEGRFADAEVAYAAARSEAEVAAAVAALEAANADLRSGRSRQRAAAVGAAAVYVASLADALLFHARGPALRVSGPVPAADLSVRPAASGAGLALRLTF